MTMSARPRLILHLGWDEATGRPLQSYLAGQFPLLRERGILYPATGRSPADPTGHALFGALFRGAGSSAAADRRPEVWPADRHELVGALLAEVRSAGADTVLVSTHDLARLDESDVHAFAEAFAEFDLAPVVVLRNFPTWLSQRYGSMVLAGAVTGEPRAGLLERGFVKRLAAWASVAADGKLCVIDADASPTGSVIQDMLAAFAIDGLPNLPPDVQPPADPVPPAIVALIREFRARGIDESNLQGLAHQLGRLPFVEHQTNLPQPLIAELDERYAKFFSRLRRSSFVHWIGTAIAPPQRQQQPIHIGNSKGAIFALGRAVDARG